MGHTGPYGPIWALMGPYGLEKSHKIHGKFDFIGASSNRPRAGLGPIPGWGPVRVGAHMGPYGPYGPIRALMDWPLWVLLDRSWQVRTCPISDFWLSFARFGSKTCFLIKFLNDSAWFLLEKLKKHIFSTKNLDI